MKKFFLLFIISLLFIAPVFTDDYYVYDIIQKIVYESFEWRYINKLIAPLFVTTSRPNAAYPETIFVSIYFNSALYDMKDEFDNIIENKLLIELKNTFPDYDITISALYPFSVLFRSNLEYNLDEMQNIITDISRNTQGIYIDNIFQNSLYGFFWDKTFYTTTDSRRMRNDQYADGFIAFIEIINKYYGTGSFIQF